VKVALLPSTLQPISNPSVSEGIGRDEERAWVLRELAGERLEAPVEPGDHSHVALGEEM
jgi:hypothetical protein